MWEMHTYALRKFRFSLYILLAKPVVLHKSSLIFIKRNNKVSNKQKNIPSLVILHYTAKIRLKLKRRTKTNSE